MMTGFLAATMISMAAGALTAATVNILLRRAGGNDLYTSRIWNRGK